MSECIMNTQCGYRDYRIQVYTDDYQLYNLIEMQIVKIREAYMNKDDLSHAASERLKGTLKNKWYNCIVDVMSIELHKWTAFQRRTAPITGVVLFYWQLKDYVIWDTERTEMDPRMRSTRGTRKK